MKGTAVVNEPPHIRRPAWGSSKRDVLLARLTDTAWQRGVGTTSLSPALPLGVQARMGVLLCGGTAPKSPRLLTTEFLLVDGGAR
jgi:hypothetical protein